MYKKLLSSSRLKHFGTVSPKISFCTTCMNRASFIKKTFKHNLNLFDGEVEFVLLNYSSSDDLEDYVKSELIDFIDSGKLFYYKTTDYDKFHVTHAKNMAHKLATGDILVNLDSDIIMSSDVYDFIKSNIINHDAYIHSRHGGTGGFISVSKKVFYDVGGYDEKLRGWGNEDADFLSRLRQFNKYACLIPDEFRKHVYHDNSLRTWDDIVFQVNCDIFVNNFRQNIIVVNEDGFGSGRVYKNFSDRTIDI